MTQWVQITVFTGLWIGLLGLTTAFGTAFGQTAPTDADPYRAYGLPDSRLFDRGTQDSPRTIIPTDPTAMPPSTDPTSPVQRPSLQEVMGRISTKPMTTEPAEPPPTLLSNQTLDTQGRWLYRIYNPEGQSFRMTPKRGYVIANRDAAMACHQTHKMDSEEFRACMDRHAVRCGADQRCGR